jgi:hypothetical protein
MLSVAPSLDALGSSSLRIPKCHFLSGEFPTNIIKVLLQKEKAEDFSPASFWLVPSPRHFAKIKLIAAAPRCKCKSSEKWCYIEPRRRQRSKSSAHRSDLELAA